MYSTRLPAGLSAAALQESVAAPGCIDLSCGNPTRCGLAPDAAALPPCVFDWQRPYAPQAAGDLAARVALAQALQGLGRPAHVDDLLLCASTSEAFAFLFKMVANPGELVAVGRPGYPLVDHLAELEGLRAMAYRTSPCGDGWRIDFAGIDRALAAGARVVVVISPNNPTGARICAEDVAALAGRCNRAGALAIFDEVFACYGRAPAPATSFVCLDAFTMAVSLGGLSKAACLPQAKLSWIHLHGSPRFRAQARAGLLWLADAFLSVNGPTVAAVPQICAAMPAVQARVRQRVEANAHALAALLATDLQAAPLGRLLPAQAGWYGVVQLGQAARDLVAPVAERVDAAPAGARALAWAAALEARANVRVASCALFDWNLPGGLVASLLLPQQQLLEGWQRLAAIARTGAVTL